MAEQPNNSEALMKGLLGDIEERVKTSQASHKMSPEERKMQKQLDRVSKRAYSGNISDIERQREQATKKAKSSKLYKSKQTARGQVGLHGSAGEEPDS